VQKRVLASIVWFALGVMLLSRISINIVDLDIFHQMALIREGMVLGHIPTADTFSYGPTLPNVIHHEWGAGAVAYFLATRFGAPGFWNRDRPAAAGEAMPHPYPEAPAVCSNVRWQKASVIPAI